MKLFHVTSTRKGPFPRGTCIIAQTDHGYFLAESKEDVLQNLLPQSVHPINLEDRDVCIAFITRRVGDRNTMGEKLNELRHEIAALTDAVEVIESWLG